MNKTALLLCKQITAISLLLCGTAHAEGGVTEAGLKAALVFNFAGYTGWPVDGRDHFSICVFNESAMFDAMKSLERKEIGGVRVSVIRADEKYPLTDCRIIYVGKTGQNSFTKIDKQPLNNASVLIVTDSVDLPAADFMIQLQTENDHLGFIVNLKTVKAAGLTISSKVLRLAKAVLQ